MTLDPLTDQLKMRSLLSYRCCHLFNEDGKPKVLLRMKRTVTDSQGIKRDFLHIEWGDLDSAFLGANKQKFIDEWRDHTLWRQANA